MVHNRVASLFVSSLAFVTAFAANAESKFSDKAIAIGDDFMPPNDLHLEDNTMFLANMTEEEFAKITDDAVNLYKPLAKTYGGNLVANKKWTDPTVNASASQFFGTWNVNMYGGLARRPEVTADGFAMVVCHELGHHFAGFPFVGNSGWAANEGQSDYFATHVCAPRLWKNQTVENAKHRDSVDSVAKERCDIVWNTVEEQNLCYRIANGGESLAKLLAALNKSPEPKFETPDTKVVSKTDDRHPAAQCRLDTYFAGALCVSSYVDSVIPARNHAKGQGSLEAEQESAKTACTASSNHAHGLRPACWFKSRL